MATSQNGWPVIDSYGSKYLTSVPKIIGKVRKDGGVAELFTHLILWFDANIEDVDRGRDDWGYNYRPIRGQSSGFSNHASGTAIDLNAQQHPRGRVNTFNAAQRAAIRKQLRDVYKGTIRWGGDYDTRIAKRDDMHFEIDASSSEIAAVLKTLAGGDVVPVGKVEHPTGAVKPKPSKPAASKQPTDYKELRVDGDFGPVTVKALQIVMRAIKTYTRAVDGDWGRYTKIAVQEWLKGLGYYKRAVDGSFGKYSVTALQNFLRAKGLYPASKYVIDGDFGPATIKAWQAYLNQQNSK